MLSKIFHLPFMVQGIFLVPLFTFLRRGFLGCGSLAIAFSGGTTLVGH